MFEVGGEALLELGELRDGQGGDVDCVGGLGLRHVDRGCGRSAIVMCTVTLRSAVAGKLAY